MNKLEPQQGMHIRDYLYTALLSGAVLAGSTACKKENKYTWNHRLPLVGCNPRTLDAKAKLGDCPKLSDPQHPRPEEIQQFVDYMNRKDAVEGTVTDQGLNAPGCFQWRIDKYGQPERFRTDKKEGCVSLEPLQRYKLP